MGMLTDEINELREMNKKFDEGKLSAEDLNVKLGIYQQTGVRAKLILQAKALDLKYGLGNGNKSATSELIGTGKIKKQKKLQDRTATRGH